MRYSIIGSILAIIIAGGAFVWLINKDGEGVVSPIHSLIVELAVPVKTKLKKTSDGNPVGYNPKMVSVTVTLRFEGQDNLNKATGEIRRLRRAYSNAIGGYLSKSEKTNNIDKSIRQIVATTSETILGAGVVIGIEVEGKFSEE